MLICIRSIFVEWKLFAGVLVNLRCPICNSQNYAQILWGLPADMKEIEEELERKEIVLGGCVVTGDDPKHECNECRTRW